MYVRAQSTYSQTGISSFLLFKPISGIAQISFLVRGPYFYSCRGTLSYLKASQSSRNVQWHAEYVEEGRPTKCKVRSALISQRRDMRSLWVLERESGAQCGRWKVWGDEWEAVTAVWGFIWLRAYPSSSWLTLHLGHWKVKRRTTTSSSDQLIDFLTLANILKPIPAAHGCILPVCSRPS